VHIIRSEVRKDTERKRNYATFTFFNSRQSHTHADGE